ncbi:MAG: MlaD family protein [Bryobacterales bacterium]|nr:MlaD family protein [Bryobacterales bacterium]
MTNEVRVGLLVIAALAISVTAFLIAANFHFAGQTHTYRTYFSYSGGLDEGNVVRFGGRKGGTIQSVEPWPEDMTKTEVVFELLTEIPVNEESVATIDSLSALAQNYLEITPGSGSAPRIPPGGVVPSVEALSFSDLTRKVAKVADEAVGLMARMDAKVTMVADSLHAVLENLRELTGEQNQRNIARMLENTNEFLETQTPKIDSLTTQLGDTLVRVEELADDFQRLARDADDTVLNINRTVDETREPLQSSLHELEGALRDAKLLLNDARALLLVNEGSVSEIIENFRDASENIEELSSDLRQRPWSILRGKPKPDRPVPPVAAPPSN